MWKSWEKLGSSFLLHKRQGKGKTAACTGHAVSFNMNQTAMPLNRGFYDCQPQTIPFDLVMTVIPHSIKTIEDMLQISGWHPIASIADTDTHHPRLIFRRNRDGTALRCIFDRITNQVPQSLTQL